MVLISIEDEFSICKLSHCNDLNIDVKYTFLAITDDEISLVCPTSKLPKNVIEVDNDWRAFKIEGTLDFSLVGIIANISKLLADCDISVFVVSTFNTDYILIKKENYNRAIDIFTKNKYTIVN